VQKLLILKFEPDLEPEKLSEHGARRSLIQYVDLLLSPRKVSSNSGMIFVVYFLTFIIIWWFCCNYVFIFRCVRYWYQPVL